MPPFFEWGELGHHQTQCGPAESTSMPCFILIHAYARQQYANVTDRHTGQDNGFLATVCKTVRPMLSDRCLSVLSVTLAYCGQMVGWIKMNFRMQIDLAPGHNVLDGDSAELPSPKGPSPQFSAHICCGQMAGWIMPLGREVGLSPSDIVLNGDPALLPEGGEPPIFGPCLLWPNGWMHQDTTW